MPRLIEPGAGAAIELDDLIEALDSTPFDARDEEEFAALGPLLARLGRNAGFLAELAVDELKGRCEAQHRGNGYGAQVFLLRPPNGRYVLRANFWPSRADPVVRASSPAAFFYDLPHDHNFPLGTCSLTCVGFRRLPMDAEPEINNLIADLEAKWAAAHGKSGSPEAREYTAAAHWAVPRLIAEIRRLRAEPQ